VNEEYARYGLLVILIPIGLTALLLMLEHRLWARCFAICIVSAWACLSAADNLRLTARYASSSTPLDLRVLSDALVARGIHVAIAPYWTAYAVTFMTDERVKVASSDYVRIDEYQRLAAAEPALVRISDQPCRGGEQVARWYLCR
jgi:hypothetical protein